MSLDESEAISNMLEYGWLDPDKINEVICWNGGKTYRARITFVEVTE